MVDPGWDVSLTSDDQGLYLSAYGLGSPFPEDAKLCAALNSFWPAVAPDAGRTFDYSPTAIPMMDSELGYHPNHPSVRSGFVESSRGWDGEYGPFVEVVAGRRFINAASIRRSDYVTNALRQRIDIRKTSGVDSQELIRRMEALRFAITVLPPPGDHVSNTKLWLVQAESIDEWRQDPRRVDAALIGRGLVYVFAKYNNRQTPKRTSDLTRLRYTFEHLFECRISDTIILTRKETRAWKKFDIEKVKLGHRILAA